MKSEIGRKERLLCFVSKEGLTLALAFELTWYLLYCPKWC